MKIFQKVHCRAYLQKYSDGVFLDPIDENNMPLKGSAWKDPCASCKAYKNEYVNGKWETRELADLSDFEGNTVPKEYRRRIEEEFDGFLVGITQITVRGEIGTDSSDYVYNMEGDVDTVFHLTKKRYQKQVAVVYFKNNAKRYVPLEDMKIVGKMQTEKS